ncbi:PREDICTED: uncharacterized protein LOC109149034 [Ipomoea nil]|uniref:uncharacterized protein LOC109149034 n=1 Tax=Ipomoea nil TaxID=35883 RepID=UPI000901D499|nr:PREDICTED: uncharacterized protein LOC109149034 [Ipomoea nil]
MQRGRGDQDGSSTLSNTFGKLGEKISTIFGKSLTFGSFFGSNSPPSKATLPDDLPETSRSSGPVIEELDTDDDDGEVEKNGGGDLGENRQKILSTSWANRNPVVEHPEDLADDHNEIKKLRKNNVSFGPIKGTQSVGYRRVTYGGIHGAYLTATTTRQTGSDGRVWEETKHADVTTGEATHTVSRGIHDKGHTLTRKLKSNGKVDTVETLHNLEEDELVGFDRDWKCNANKHLPGWNVGRNYNTGSTGNSFTMTNRDSPFREGFRGLRPDLNVMARPSRARHKKVVTINIE